MFYLKLTYWQEGFMFLKFFNISVLFSWVARSNFLWEEASLSSGGGRRGSVLGRCYLATGDQRWPVCVLLVAFLMNKSRIEVEKWAFVDGSPTVVSLKNEPGFDTLIPYFPLCQDANFTHASLLYRDTKTHKSTFSSLKFLVSSPRHHFKCYI